MINPDTPDPGFPYWENLSWENADKYQPDVLLLDSRNFDDSLATGEKQPTWDSIRAAKAGSGHLVAGVLAAHLRRLRRRAGEADRRPRGHRRERRRLTRWRRRSPRRRRRGSRTAGPRRRGLGLGLLVLLGALGLVTFLSVTQGSRDISLGEVLRAFGDFGDRHGERHGHAGDAGAAHDHRAAGRRRARARPGALLQGVTRNPLADPGIMGVNAGAAAAVVAGDHPARRRRGVVLHLVRLRRGRTRHRPGLRRRLARPRRCDAGQAGAGRRGGHRRAHVVHLGDDHDQRRALDELRFWQVGSLAGRYAPVVSGVGAVRDRRAACSRCCAAGG